jgi:hypothetical protein
MTLLALGVGDIHEDGPVSKLIPDYSAMTGRELDRVCAYARERGISIIFHYGDVGDSPRMSYEGQRELLRHYRRNKDMEFHIILGNHDKYAPDSAAGHSLDLLLECVPKNVHIYTEPTEVEIAGHTVRFLPWPHQSFSRKCLNVAHIETAGSVSDSGRAFEGADLYKGSAVAVIGHLHTMQKSRNRYYSGTLWQQNFGESSKKYFHHIEWNGPEDYEITNVRFRSEYTLHTVVISSSKDLESIPQGPKDLVKLVVRDGADVDAASWARMTNVVKVNAYRTKEELAEVVAADLNSGQTLVIDTTEFFNSWIAQQSFDEKRVKRLSRLRHRVLTGEPLRKRASQ